MPVFMARDVSAALGADAKQCTNRALFISKYPILAETDQDKKYRLDSLNRMVRLEEDAGGREFRTGFLRSLQTCSKPARVFQAALRARMIVNQAGGVVENAGLCLDRHFGIPYIPGSALKGIARAAARERESRQEKILAVFGWSAGDRGLPKSVSDISFAGSVAFLPSYTINKTLLELDIVTCHHAEYYRLGGVALDTEAPIPNPFPAVAAGAEFLFSLVQTVSKERLSKLSRLELPEEFDPLTAAYEWLLYGITELGVGAKTSAGYGWFAFDRDAETSREEAAGAEREAREKERQRVAEEALRREEEERRLAAMPPEERALQALLDMDDESFAAFAKALSEKQDYEKKAFFQGLRGPKKERWKTWRKKKPQLAEAIRKEAEGMGEVLS